MGIIIFLIIIWLVIGFIYSKVKNISFIKGLFAIPLAIISALLSESSSSLNEAKRQAKKQNNQEALYKAEEMEMARKNAKQKVDNIKNNINK